MTSFGRVPRLKTFFRRRRQLMFVTCVALWLSVLSSFQYLITAALVDQWPVRWYLPVSLPLSISLSKGLPTTEDAVTAAAVESGRRRTLGMTMPNIDYAAFKRLEARSAAANDVEVIRIAREAMAPPVDRLKIRNIRKTAQAALVDKVLRNKTGGFFVECGAYDGETSSNTVYLEQTRKWTGLLIEMDAAFYTQMVGKRRRAWTINACLSNRQSVLEMRYFESNGQLGRLSIDNSTGRRQPPNYALCFPLESLLLALNRTQIDYFSLDVEGFELDVLRSLPLGRLHIDVISAEFRHAREPASEYTRVLSDHNYSLYATVNSMDYIFVKNYLLNSEYDKVTSQIATSRTPLVRTSADKVRRQKQLGLLKNNVESANVITTNNRPTL